MSLNVSRGGDFTTNLFQCFITCMVKSFSWWQIGRSPIAACGCDTWLSLRTQYSVLYTPLHKMLYNVMFSEQTDFHIKFMCKSLFLRVFHRVRFPRLGRQPQPWRLCSFSFLERSIVHFWCQREVHLVVLHVWNGWWEHLLYPSTNLEQCESSACCASHLVWTMEPANSGFLHGN